MKYFILNFLFNFVFNVTLSSQILKELIESGRKVGFGYLEEQNSIESDTFDYLYFCSINIVVLLKSLKIPSIDTLPSKLCLCC